MHAVQGRGYRITNRLRYFSLLSLPSGPCCIQLADTVPSNNGVIYPWPGVAWRVLGPGADGFHTLLALASEAGLL